MTLLRDSSMPRVKARYFALLRELLGDTREEKYNIEDGTTLLDLLLEHIPKRHRKVSAKWKERIFEMDGAKIKFDKYGTPVLSEYYLILMNGRYYNSISKMGLMYHLRDGDVIAVLPPVGGG
jgi:MoaD family protein